jgi:hypothetical protein
LLLPRRTTELSQEHRAQRLPVQVQDDVAAEAATDRSTFFANDDDDSIGFFGDAECRAMARAEACIEHFGFGHWEEDAGTRNLEVADEHRTIVKFVDGLRDEHADE